MTAREYLCQGGLLEQRIASGIRRAEAMRALAASISTPAADAVRVLSSVSGEAPFIRALESAESLEEQAAADMELLLDLKDQMEQTICTVPEEKLRLVLACRYLEHMTWPEIAESLHISRGTVRARHDAALSLLILPDHPIDINDPVRRSARPAAAW